MSFSTDEKLLEGSQFLEFSARSDCHDEFENENRGCRGYMMVMTREEKLSMQVYHGSHQIVSHAAENKAVLFGRLKIEQMKILLYTGLASFR